MNEELTRAKEQVEQILTERLAYYPGEYVRKLMGALLAKLDEPSVWDGAPEWATIGRACWTDKKHGEAWSIIYQRELPKTRTRQIAEEVTALVNRAIDGISVKEVVALLNKYAEELTNTKEAE